MRTNTAKAEIGGLFRRCFPPEIGEPPFKRSSSFPAAYVRLEWEVADQSDVPRPQGIPRSVTAWRALDERGRCVGFVVERSSLITAYLNRADLTMREFSATNHEDAFALVAAHHLHFARSVDVFERIRSAFPTAPSYEITEALDDWEREILGLASLP